MACEMLIVTANTNLDYDATSFLCDNCQNFQNSKLFLCDLLLPDNHQEFSHSIRTSLNIN